MYTLETETHLSLSSGVVSSVAAAAMTTTNDHHVSGKNLQAAVQARQESMVEMMESLTIRMDQMEHTVSQLMEQQSFLPKLVGNRNQGPIIC